MYSDSPRLSMQAQGFPSPALTSSPAPQFPTAEPAYPMPEPMLTGDARSLEPDYVEENMDIDPGAVQRHDEEFALRPPMPPRGRFRRFGRSLLRALMFPFRMLSPRFRRGRRAEAGRQSGQTGSYDFRDRTPAASTSVRLTYTRDRDADGNEPAQGGLMSPVPVTVVDIPPENESQSETEDETDETGEDALDRRTSQRSRLSRHSRASQSQKSRKALCEAEDNDTVRHNVPCSPNGNVRSSLRTSFAPGLPPQPPPSAKSSNQSNRPQSFFSVSTHSSSLVYHVVRLYHTMRALNHLPWVAAPPRRITVDFVPAYSSARSKYKMRRDLPVPAADLAAARAIKDMAEAESWYLPSVQQIRKHRSRRHGSRRSRHSDHYQQLPGHRREPAESGLPSYMFGGFPTSPGSATTMFGMQGSPYAFPYGGQAFYLYPGAPNHSSPRVGPTGAPDGSTAARPTRPASVVSVSTARQRQQARSSHSLGHNTTSSPGGGRERPDMPRSPPPVAQPMYIMPTFPPGMQPLPPSYTNVFPYQYSPVWMPNPSLHQQHQQLQQQQQQQQQR